MNSSQKLLDHIIQWEKYRSRAYIPMKGDVPTIGFGFTTVDGKKVQLGDTITYEKAMYTLKSKLFAIDHILAIKPIPDTVTQEQYDAVVSLIYNIGMNRFLTSDTSKKFYNGENIANKFDMWTLFKGKPCAGLIKRRASERKLYEEGIYA